MHHQTLLWMHITLKFILFINYGWTTMNRHTVIMYCIIYTSLDVAQNNLANTKHLYTICTMLDQCWRCCADVVQMLYNCFVFAGILMKTLTTKVA